MKIKRLICGAVSAALLAVMALSGCGNENQSSAGKYTIDWYHITGTVPGDTTKVEAAVNEYLDGKLGAELKLHFFDWSAYDQKINVMIAGGDKFDICYTAGDVYRMNASKNAFVALNDMLDEYAPNTKELLGEEFLEGSQVNGVNYGIPANKDKGHHFGIMYRTDIAEKLGLTDALSQVKTMNDLYPILDVVKEKEPEIVPLVEYATHSEASFNDFDTMAFPAGMYLSSTEDKIVNIVETPEYKEASLKTKANRDKGYTRAGGITPSKEIHFAEIVSLKPGKDKELSSSRIYDYTQVDMTTPYMTSSDTSGSLMAISRTSKNPQIALQFLEMFNTDAYLNNLIVYGIEDEHYTKNPDGSITPIKDSGYGNAGMQWEFGNVFLNYPVEGEDLQKAAKMEAYNKALVPSRSLGFSVDLSSIQSEVSACQNVKAEFSERLSSAADEDAEATLNQYIEKLRAAGSEKIVAEVQNQYDAWRANR